MDGIGWSATVSCALLNFGARNFTKLSSKRKRAHGIPQPPPAPASQLRIESVFLCVCVLSTELFSSSTVSFIRIVCCHGLDSSRVCSRLRHRPYSTARTQIDCEPGIASQIDCTRNASSNIGRAKILCEKV